MDAGSSFVGRGRELAVLRGRLSEALAGRGQIVLVAGEPGIGKSRLAEELLRPAGELGTPVGWGRASEDEGSPPYWVFRQAGRSAGPQLHDRLAGALHPTGSADGRFGVFEAVADELRAAAGPAGLVLVLDDLQWADAASLSLLVHVARGIGPSRLLLLATYRDTEITGRDALHAALSALARESRLTRIRLVGLSRDEVAEQLLVLRGAPVPDELATLVNQRSGGNPFFVAELGRLAETARDGLPEGVVDTVRARLARVGATCRHLIATAAALGSEIDLVGLASVVQRPVGDVLDDLDHAAEAGLVTDAGGWRFGHDLVRETARLDLTTAARLSAHDRFATVLEERFDAPARTAEIAHHRLEALPVGDPERAAHWAERAADEALDQLAWEEAARLYRRALDSGGALSPADRARLLRRGGTAQVRAGDMNAGAPTLAAAADAAREAMDPVALGEVALVYEGIANPWGSFRGGPLAAEALAALPETDTPLRARLLALQAGEAGFLGGPEPDRLSAAALAMAERLDDTQVLRSALRARQMARAGPDGVTERLAVAERMLALGGAEGDHEAVAWGRFWRFDALLMLGRLDEAEAELRLVGPTVQHSRRPVARWHYLRSQAALDVGRGRFDEAVAAAQEATALLEGQVGDGVPAAPFGVLAVVAGLTGRHDMLPDSMLEGMDVGAPRIVGRLVAMYWLLLGNRDRARQLFSSGRLGPVPAPTILPAYAVTVVLAAEFGEPGQVAEAEARLRPYPELFVCGGAGAVLVTGSVHGYLGVAAAVLGRLDDAVRELRLGVAANERAGTPPFAAQTQYDLARVLARRRRPGDIDEAAALATSVADRAAQLGMAPLRRDAEALAGSLRGDVPGPLTAREREVVGYVAQGLTNRQTAAALHISERTVESHVQHILAKLGLANRAQVVGWAAANGIRTAVP